MAKPSSMQAGRAVVRMDDGGVSIPPAVSAGSVEGGMSLTSDILPMAAAKAAQQAKELVVEVRKKGRWVATPSVVDQFTDPRFRAYVRQGPPQAAVYDLSLAKDVATLNSLLSRSHPSGSPQIIVSHDEKQVVGQKWLCCISYRVIEYQEIITTVTHGPSTAPDTPPGK